MNKLTKEEALEMLKTTIKIYEQMANDEAGQEFVEAFKMSVEALENQKTGHWIKEWHIDHFEYVCSECDCGEEFQTHYCPNCGAKMVGE